MHELVHGHDQTPAEAAGVQVEQLLPAPHTHLARAVRARDYRHVVDEGGGRDKGDAGGSVGDVLHRLFHELLVLPGRLNRSNRFLKIQNPPWECFVKLVLDHPTRPEKLRVSKVGAGERSTNKVLGTNQNVTFRKIIIRIFWMQFTQGSISLPHVMIWLHLL